MARKTNKCVILNTLNEDIILDYKSSETIIPPKGKIEVETTDVNLDKLPKGLKFQVIEG